MRNPLKPQHPTSATGAVRHGVKNAVLLFVPGALVFAAAAMQPVPMEFVAPESSQSAVAQSATDRAMAQCEDLPAGTLPGAAVISWDGGAVDYTTDPKAVDLAFNFALGEHSPRIAGVTLCR